MIDLILLFFCLIATAAASSAAASIVWLIGEFLGGIAMKQSEFPSRRSARF